MQSNEYILVTYYTHKFVYYDELIKIIVGTEQLTYKKSVYNIYEY